MKKVVALFNGPYLGGAERSFSLQTEILKKSYGQEVQVDFIVPYLRLKNEANDLVNYLKELNFNEKEISYLPYDKRLFSMSRGHSLLRLLLLPISLFKTILPQLIV